MLSPRILGKDRWLEYFALGCGGGVCTRASTITPWSSLLTADCDIPRSGYAETRQQQKPQARQSSKEATRVEAMAKEIGRKGKAERVALEQTKDPITGHRSFKVLARRSETDSVVPRAAAAWRTSKLTEGRPEAGQLAQPCTRVERVTNRIPLSLFGTAREMGSKVVYTGDPAKTPAAASQAAAAPPPLPPPPPPYSPAPSTSAPPAGLRVPCSTSTPFPQDLAGPAPLRDLDGSPVWVASALFKDGSVRMLLAPMWGGAKRGWR